MIKIDLHTHSRASNDGGISLNNYKIAIDSGKLDVVAVTDHSDIENAKIIAADAVLKGNVIVGQEIKTSVGEIIGLFLNKQINDGMSADETVLQIKKQHGFVIIPHPEDPHRNGMSLEDMETIVEDIDAVEVFNGRQIGRQNPDIRHWARQHNLAVIASSDAHSPAGLGWTFTVVDSIPTSADELRETLNEKSKPIYERPPLRAFLAPKLNRLSKLWRRV